MTPPLLLPYSRARMGYECLKVWFAMFGFAISTAYLVDFLREVSKLPAGFGWELFDAAFFATIVLPGAIYGVWLENKGRIATQQASR